MKGSFRFYVETHKLMYCLMPVIETPHISSHLESVVMVILCRSLWILLVWFGTVALFRFGTVALFLYHHKSAEIFTSSQNGNLYIFTNSNSLLGSSTVHVPQQLMSDR